MSALDACQGVGQVPAELDRLTALYLERQPRTVLEIGVWHGGTLRVWLENAAPHATVVAVDPAHLTPENYEGWRKPDTMLIVGEGRSEDLTGLIGARAPYDWVFIDGDHSAAAVRFDVALALPLIRPGGLILLHDITAAGYPPLAPRIAYEDLRAAGHPGWEIIEPPPEWYPAECGHGIGVVQL